MIKIAFIMVILAIASYYDLKTREVPNRLWKYALLLSLPFIIYDFYSYGRYSIIEWIISILYAAIVLLILYSIHKIEAADSKAIMFISILIPSYTQHISCIKLFFPFSLIVLLLASIIGFVFVVIVDKRKEIPFIVFITISFICLSVIYI